MAIALNTYSGKSEISIDGLTVTKTQKTIYTAPLNGCIVNHLQITNVGDYDSVVIVKTFDSDDVAYRVISLALQPKQSVFPLEKTQILEAGNYLTIEADSNDIQAVLNVSENFPTDLRLGSLTVNIEDDFGRWSIDNGENWYDPGETKEISEGSYTLVFEEITNYTEPINQEITIIKGTSTEINADKYIKHPEKGTILVGIYGTDDGRWSIDDGATWNEHNTSLLVDEGDYDIKYKAVEGYITPGTLPITVEAHEIVETAGFYRAEYEMEGTYLQVNMVNNDSAKWSIDDGETWNDSGEVIEPEEGEYEIIFEDNAGYNAPESMEIEIEEGIAVVKNAYYTKTVSTGNYELWSVGWDKDLGTYTLEKEKENVDINNVYFSNSWDSSLSLKGSPVFPWAGAGIWAMPEGVAQGADLIYFVGYDNNLYIMSEHPITSEPTTAIVDDSGDWDKVVTWDYVLKQDGTLCRITNDGVVSLGNVMLAEKGFLSKTYFVGTGIDNNGYWYVYGEDNISLVRKGPYSDWRKITGDLEASFFDTIEDWHPIGLTKSGRIYVADVRTLLSSNTNWVDVYGKIDDTGKNPTALALSGSGRIFGVRGRSLVEMGTGFENVKLNKLMVKENGEMYLWDYTNNPKNLVKITEYDDWVMCGSGYAIRQTT